MKLMSFESFMEDFGNAIKPTMNMSIYRDSFACACGKSHWFDERVDIVCEGRMKVMVTCPENSSYVSSLKIKTFMVFKFKGFETLAGMKLKDEQDEIGLNLVRRVVRSA